MPSKIQNADQTPVTFEALASTIRTPANTRRPPTIIVATLLRGLGAFVFFLGPGIGR